MIKKYIKVFLTILILCCIFPQIVSAQIIRPTNDFYVADYANVLNDDTAKYIININESLYEQTGVQIVVVTVDFLDGMDIEDYAYTLFNEWGIGSSVYNNGVLILLVIGEDNYWMSCGSGLENHLTPTYMGDLLYDYLEEDFAVKEYDSGTKKLFDAIIESLVSYYNVTFEDNDLPAINESTKDDSSSKLGVFGIILIIIILLVVGFFISAFIAGIIDYRRKRVLGIPIASERNVNEPIVKNKRKIRKEDTNRSIFGNRKDRKKKNKDKNIVKAQKTIVEKQEPKHEVPNITAESLSKPSESNLSGSGGSTFNEDDRKIEYEYKFYESRKEEIHESSNTHKDKRKSTGGGGSSRGGGTGRSSANKNTSSKKDASGGPRSSGNSRSGGGGSSRGGGSGRRK